MTYSKAKYKANTKYNKKKYKDFKFRVRRDNEEEIIDYLSMQRSINEYIKELIKKDMNSKK